MTERETLEKWWHAVRSTPDDLRKRGWRVILHIDFPTAVQYALVKGEQYVQGTGENDEVALDNCRRRVAELEDDRHHAPMCPANHYRGQRAPTGPCNCGNEKAEWE